MIPFKNREKGNLSLLYKLAVPQIVIDFNQKQIAAKWKADSINSNNFSVHKISNPFNMVVNSFDEKTGTLASRMFFNDKIYQFFYLQEVAKVEWIVFNDDETFTIPYAYIDIARTTLVLNHTDKEASVKFKVKKGFNENDELHAVPTSTVNGVDRYDYPYIPYIAKTFKFTEKSFNYVKNFTKNINPNTNGDMLSRYLRFIYLLENASYIIDHVEIYRVVNVVQDYVLVKFHFKKDSHLVEKFKKEFDISHFDYVFETATHEKFLAGDPIVLFENISPFYAEIQEGALMPWRWIPCDKLMYDLNPEECHTYQNYQNEDLYFQRGYDEYKIAQEYNDNKMKELKETFNDFGVTFKILVDEIYS